MMTDSIEAMSACIAGATWLQIFRVIPAFE